MSQHVIDRSAVEGLATLLIDVARKATPAQRALLNFIVERARLSHYRVATTIDHFLGHETPLELRDAMISLCAAAGMNPTVIGIPPPARGSS
ncbi:MAG: hypothetical protein U1A78_32120 [Polyangia bacterium]